MDQGDTTQRRGTKRQKTQPTHPTGSSQASIPAGYALRRQGRNYYAIHFVNGVDASAGWHELVASGESTTEMADDPNDLLTLIALHQAESTRRSAAAVRANTSQSDSQRSGDPPKRLKSVAVQQERSNPPPHLSPDLGESDNDVRLPPVQDGGTTGGAEGTPAQPSLFSQLGKRITRAVRPKRAETATPSGR